MVSRLSIYRGLLIYCTSCWLLSHLGLLRLERSGVRVLGFYLDKLWVRRSDELWVVSRLSMYRGLLINCTSCWLLSHLGLIRLESLPVYQRRLMAAEFH